MESMLFLVVWVCVAVLCARVAQKKGRDPVIWGIVGCLTSFAGLIVLAMCSDKKKEDDV